jgi:hypothetical protein
MVARGAAVLLSASVVLYASGARADAASDAKDLFERGRQLRAAGDCANALPLFHKAYEVFPSALGPLRNAAECEEATGRWASAHRSWLDLKRGLLVSHDAKYDGWEGDADSAARRLSPRIAHLRVDVSTSGKDASALEVTVNGEPLPPTLMGTTLDRDPGKYVVRARLSTGEPAEQTVDLVTGEGRVIRLVVAPPGEPLPVQPSNDAGSPLTPAGWITVSVGLATLVGMGVAIGVRQDALSSLTTQCPSYATSACDPSVKPVVDRGNAASTAATVLAVAGGLVTGVGVVLIIVGASAHHGAPREHVAVALSPFGVGLSGSF